jgi:uncharacterized ion transporter superfamily protein YfcC
LFQGVKAGAGHNAQRVVEDHESDKDKERNSMNRAISLALFIGGIVLIAYGISASNSFSSGISRAFIGAPTEKTTWLLICGGAAAIVGHAGMIRGSRKP